MSEDEEVFEEAEVPAEDTEVSGESDVIDDPYGREKSLRQILEEQYDSDEEETPDGVDGVEDTEALVAGGRDGEEAGEAGEAVEGALPAEGAVPKAPIDWTPQEREQWSKVPAAIQARIKAREADIAQQLEGSAGSRQVSDRVNQLAQSYAPVMAAEGVHDPMMAIEGLFQKVAELRMGSPSQKAQLVASIVNDYGVDVSLLDNALVGGGQGTYNGNQPPQIDPSISNIIDQKMAPINGMMDQLNQLYQQKQQQSQVDAQAQVDEFAKNAEFLHDVRQDMADLIDLAAKNGRELTLEQAYDKACAMHPEIGGILEQRRQNESIATAAQGVAAKQNASSSIRGTKTGTGSAGLGTGSLRSQIENAWDDSYS